MHGPVPLLHDFLEHSARRLPEKVALVAPDEPEPAHRLTYRDVDAAANRLAGALVKRGVERGDRVVVLAENGPTTAIAFWAALKANAVAVVLHPQTKLDKLRYVLRDCRPAALVAEGPQIALAADAATGAPSLCARLAAGAVAPPPGWEPAAAATATERSDRPPLRRCIELDLAAIVYTSGSTGDPKGVMLTHRNMLSAATSISAYLRLREDDVVLNALPLSFDYGLYQWIMACRAGARLVLERGFAFPMQSVERMVAEGVTGFPGVPTMFALLAELRSLAGARLPKLRFVTNTAAALPVKHIRLLQTLFPEARIYSMYGLTECKRVSYLPPEDLDRKPDSVGFPIPNTEIWIVDEEGRRVGPNVVGELVVRGPTVMKGYWEKPEATACKLKPGSLPGEQVLHTGDLCRIDQDGYLYFVARSDDVIKSRGEKVSPKEVENALVGIPGIREAAVIGVPDELLGQAVKAYVVLENGAALTPQAIKLECQKRLEPALVPKFVVVVPSLPKTGSGKIKKTELT